MKEEVPDSDMLNGELVLTVVQPMLCELTLISLPELHKQDDKYQDSREITRFKGYINKYAEEDMKCLFLNLLSCSSNMGHLLSKEILSRQDLQGTRTIEHPTCFGYFFIQDDIDKESAILNRGRKESIGFKEISKQIIRAFSFHPLS